MPIAGRAFALIFLLSLLMSSSDAAPPKGPSANEPTMGGLPHDSRPSDLKVRRFSNVEFARVGRSSLLLDLYLPEKKSERLPVILWVHGGGWAGGNKDEEFPQPTVGPEMPVVLTVNRDGWSANGRKD